MIYRYSLITAIVLFLITLPGCINKDVTGKVSVRYSADAQLPPSIGAVMGTVRDQEGEPLVNASVILEGLEKYDRETGVSGAFSFADIPPGKYVITARRWDMRTLARDIEVKPGEATNVTFFLSRNKE